MSTNPWQEALTKRLKKAGVAEVPDDPEKALSLFALKLAKEFADSALVKEKIGKIIDKKAPPEGNLLINNPNDVTFDGGCVSGDFKARMEGPVPALVMKHRIGGKTKEFTLIFNHPDAATNFLHAVHGMISARMFPDQCKAIEMQ